MLSKNCHTITQLLQDRKLSKLWVTAIGLCTAAADTVPGPLDTAGRMQKSVWPF